MSRDAAHRAAFHTAQTDLLQPVRVAPPGITSAHIIREETKKQRVDSALLHRIRKEALHETVRGLVDLRDTDVVRIRDKIVAKVHRLAASVSGLVGSMEHDDLCLFDSVCPLHAVVPRMVTLLQQEPTYEAVRTKIVSGWYTTHNEKVHDQQRQLPTAEPKPKQKKKKIIEAGTRLCGQSGVVVHRFKVWLDTVFKHIRKDGNSNELVADCSVVLRLTKFDDSYDAADMGVVDIDKLVPVSVFDIWLWLGKIVWSSFE